MISCQSSATEKLYVAGSLQNGPSFDIAENNGFLYVTQGSEVRVYDIRNSETLKDLNWKDYISRIQSGSELRSIYIENHYIFLAGTGGLLIADIKNPFEPKIISSLNNPFPGTSIRDIEIYEKYAYLPIYGKGIQIIDISDLNSPKLGKIVPLPGYNRPWRVYALKNCLYAVSATDNRLDIIDITDPNNPNILGSYSPNNDKNSFSGVAVKGDYAYVTEYHNGIRVIDISDPKKPYEISSLMDINANDIKIQDNKAYVSVRYQGFNIIDVSNPKNIFITGRGTDIKGYMEGIYPTQDFTYISGESKGFGIYSTKDKSNPELLVNVPVIGGIDSITVNEEYAYIGAHNDGMWIIDIHDKKNPIERYFIAAPGRFEDIFLKDKYLFSAGQWGGLNMIDVSDPYHPMPVFMDYKDNIGSVLAEDNYIYTSAGIVELINPSSPEYICREPFFNGKLSLLRKNILLVAANTGESYGIRVIDISDKKNPRLLTTYDIETRFQDIDSFSDKAVAISGNTIRIIDFSDINNPKTIDEISYKGKWSGRSIDIDSGICYAAGGPVESIKVLDSKDFSGFSLLRYSDIPGVYNCIDYEDGYIYAGYKFGLFILTPDEKYKNPNYETVNSLPYNYDMEEGSGFENVEEIFGSEQPKKIPFVSAPVILTAFSFLFVYIFKKMKK